MKLVFAENGTVDDVMLELDFSGLRQDTEFVAASEKFENYLEVNAAACGMTQTVVTSLCHLAADATRAAMGFTYKEGLNDGVELARSVQQHDKPTNSDGHTVPFPS